MGIVSSGLFVADGNVVPDKGGSSGGSRLLWRVRLATDTEGSLPAAGGLEKGSSMTESGSWFSRYTEAGSEADPETSGTRERIDNPT